MSKQPAVSVDPTFAPRHKGIAWPLGGYYVTLILLFICSFFPGLRVWGLGMWANMPAWIPVALLAVGALIPFVLLRFPVRPSLPDDIHPGPASNRSFITASAGIVAIAGILFWLLRARVHFYGDGLAHLDNMSSANPLVKPRELGTELLISSLARLFGDGTTGDALLAYQLVSITSGVVFAAMIAWFAGMFFSQLRDRLLFLLLMLTGGYSLLFFGYVENYAPLLVAMTLSALMGLAAMRGLMNKWLLLIPLSVTVFFHVLGIVLLPAILYCVASGTPISRRIHHCSTSVKVLLGAALTAIVFAALFHFYQNDYFLQFAVLSPSENRFTLGGYTLFAAVHLVDFANLVFLLCPGALVLIAVLPSARMGLLGSRETRFLAVLVLSLLAASFMIDPKLGLPRDWDMLSLPGFALVLWAALLMLGSTGRRVTSPVAPALVIVLGILSLVPRAWVQAQPQLSIKQADSWFALNGTRARGDLINLSYYFYATGDSTQGDSRAAQAQQYYPENPIVRRGIELLGQDSILAASDLADSALVLAPRSAPAWVLKGQCYYDLRRYDSALTCLLIANGHGPYYPDILNELGRCYLAKGDLKRAERVLRRAASIDTSHAHSMYYLAVIYRARGDHKRSVKCLDQAASRSSTTANLLREIGSYWITQQDYQKAASTFLLGIQKGLDTNYVRRQAEEHPELRSYLPTL